MKHCKYIVNGVPYKYDDLVNLMKNDSELVNDILYSLDTGV
jgi:hypothetical protein